MKKFISILLMISIFLFVTACQNSSQTNGDGEQQDAPYEIVYAETFTPYMPYAALDDEVLESIGADDFTGSDSEISQQILDWQNKNMQYIGDPNKKSDISYPMRWNYMIPGIYPVSEMVSERVLDDGKIYGLCWDYAAIYCAIANSYGLETRITAYKKYMSDINSSIDSSTKQGLSLSEYNELNKKLTANNVEFTYGQIDRVAHETWVHYRAEVFLDGEWVPMDGTSVSGEYKSGTYEEVTWYEGYNNVLLYAPSAMENDVLDLDNLAELLNYAPQDGYIGVTDDAGNTNRAESFIDLVRGKGLVPYYEEPDKILGFLNIPANRADDVLDDADEITSAYENGTGKHFYTIADLLIYSDLDDDEDVPASEYVKIYNAITGENMTEEEFNKYVN